MSPRGVATDFLPQHRSKNLFYFTELTVLYKGVFVGWRERNEVLLVFKGCHFVEGDLNM